MTILRRWLDSTEELSSVDQVSERVQGPLHRAVADTPVERLLGGSWLGHPVHPLLIVFPIGLWLSAAYLDLWRGHEDAARRLIAAGLLTVPPAVAAGAVDWSGLDARQRRVGLVHAVANAAASSCYMVSLRCRRGGRHRSGQLWALLGLAGIAAGGALGGHLSYAMGAGVNRGGGRRV